MSMRMRRKFPNRILAACLCTLLLGNALAGNGRAAEQAYSSYVSLPPVEMELKESYADYIQKYSSAARPEQPISIPVQNYTQSDYTPMVGETAGKQALLTKEEGYVEWEFDVPQDGLYTIQVDYFPTSGKSSSIIRTVYIDGELPFEQMRSVVFDRVWVDKKDADGNTIRVAPNGNEIRPEQIEAARWQTTYLKDSIGYYPEPFQFYFTQGKHTLRFEAVREPMEIGSIVLCQMKQPPAYQQAKQDFDQRQLKPAQAEPVKLQGERADTKSDPMLVPIYDRSNAGMEPSDPVHLKLNCIGSTQWQINGQSITWNFKVPADGLYQISFRGIQNIKNGSVSSRKIYINGEVPYQELNDYAVAYSTQWNMYTLGQGGEDYAFYFEKDKEYSLTFEVTLGKLADIIREVNDIVNELNKIYREILVVTGPTPDPYRDYQFKETMPDMLNQLRVQNERLQKAADQIVQQSGMQGESVQIFKRMLMQTKEMIEKPEDIAKRFNAFQQNISSLGTWVSSESMQPLAIDYLLLSPAGQPLPKAGAGFLSECGYQVNSFVASFFNDYNNLSYGDEKDAVSVWVGNGMTGGRDQAQILKNMADNDFSSTSHINANIQLISMGALLPATLAGKGPDIALTLSASDVCNYAFRGAVLDLASFPDYQSVADRFHKSAVEPLSFEQGVYGLPETQTFPVLFYRKDILSALRLAIPRTWDDVIVMLPMLQKSKMSFGLPSAIATPTGGMNYKNLLLLLFQNGGELYTKDAKATLLDSPTAVDAFSFMTSLYTDYGLYKEYNFLNQFRAGSVPIGISDYSLYNQLSVFAPELEGIWDFTSVPGTVREDGTIDRTVPGEVNACMILSKSKQPEKAREFVKWWTSAETQAKFGKELESTMGTAARYPTANLEALYSIPWSKADFEKIKAQMEWLKGVPEVPGGYYTQRYMDFAFKDVVNAGEDPAKMLTEAARNINNEISMKREEFGLEK